MTDQETKTPVVPIVPNQYFARFSDKELCEFYKDVIQDKIPPDAKIRQEVAKMNEMITNGEMINWTTGLSNEIYVIGVWQHLFYEMSTRFAKQIASANINESVNRYNDIDIPGIVSVMAEALDDEALQAIFIALDSDSEEVYNAFGKITKERVPALFEVPELEDLDY